MGNGNPGENERKTGNRDLADLVRQSVSRHAMFGPGQALLVAVSGGADSTAMLHILAAIAGEMSLRLGVAHLNHGLRGKESESDADFVASLAEEYALPYYSESVDARAVAHARGLSLEDACRQLRYGFLLKTAAQNDYDRVAVGHHREDNAETILMGLLRGSGAAGLCGMAAARADGIVRPMIELSRARIREYVQINGLAFVTDRTNSDTTLLRNRIRLELMPKLASDFNPNIVATLNRIGAILGPEDRWLSELSRQMLDDITDYHGRGMMTLSLTGFNRLRAAARRRVLRLAIEAVKGDLRRIGLTHVTSVLQMALAGQDGAHLDLPGGILARRRGQFLEIIHPGRLEGEACRALRGDPLLHYSYTMRAPGSLSIRETGDTIRLPPVAIDDVPDFAGQPLEMAYLDADCVEFPLTVRNIRPGDRFSPLGTDGSQKLKKFFCDHKIMRQRRFTCPLLLSADHIIWVAGHRIDNAVKLTGRTTRVLKAELILA